MTRLRIMLSILGLLVASGGVSAAEPPLALYGSLPSSEIQVGATFSATLSVYSTSPEPLTLELDSPTPIGMTLLSTRWSTDTISYGRPVTITLTYRVDRLPPGGPLQTMAYTVKDGDGNLAARWVRLRILGLRRVWLPLVAT